MVSADLSFSQPLTFTDDEVDILGRTADAMSAWMGKPILAEIIDATETGFEWVVFAIPLRPDQDPSELTAVQVGGAGARLIGNKGGLPLEQSEVYVCEFLWAVQLSDTEGVRFIKIDQDGNDVAWTNNLREIMPFDVTDEPIDTDDMDDSDDGPPTTLH